MLLGSASRSLTPMRSAAFFLAAFYVRLALKTMTKFATVHYRAPWPARQESNLESGFRRPMLCPFNYGQCLVGPLGVEPRSLGLKVRYSAIELEAPGALSATGRSIVGVASRGIRLRRAPAGPAAAGLVWGQVASCREVHLANQRPAPTHCCACRRCRSRARHDGAVGSRWRPADS